MLHSYVLDHVDPDVNHLHNGKDVTFVGSVSFDLKIRLQAFDPDSGIYSSRWCLGTLPGMCDVLSPEPVDHRLQLAEASVAELIDGVTYYALCSPIPAPPTNQCG